MRRRRRPTLHHAVKDKRVTVLGPVKQPEMDFMSHRGGFNLNPASSNAKPLCWNYSWFTNETAPNIARWLEIFPCFATWRYCPAWNTNRLFGGSSR